MSAVSNNTIRVNFKQWSRWSDPQTAYFTVIQSGVPGLATGEPGVAKGALHFAFARAIGLPLIHLVGSCRAPEDFGGLPTPDRDAGYVRMMPTEWAARASVERCVVFLDELTTVLAPTQAPMLSILTENKCGDTLLHPGTVYSAACNPPDMATNGSPLSKAMTNRFYHHRWAIDMKSWLDGLLAGLKWENPQFPILPEAWSDHVLTYSRLVAGFLKGHPDRLLAVPQDDETMAYPTPRSWTNLVKALAAAASVGAPDDVKATISEGIVGRAVSVEFQQYVHYLDLVDPDAVLEGAAKWEWDAERIDRNEAFLCALCVAIKNNSAVERWERGMELLFAAGKACPEAALLHMNALLESKPSKLIPSRAVSKAMADLRARCGI